MAFDQTWAKHYRLPPAAYNMMQKHVRGEEIFVQQGSQMQAEIENCITRFLPATPIADLRILDFGCGVGRVALPFFFRHKKPTACVDVDRRVIDYLLEVLPEANPEVIEYDPPTRFESGSFDVIYAISVWTHLPPDKSEAWLAEMVRLLAPGGIALITTSGFRSLELRRKSFNPSLGWRDVSDDDLRNSGTIFKQESSPPGTGTYGMASHSPDWIRQNWSRHMNVLEIVEAGLLDNQDIVVMSPLG